MNDKLKSIAQKLSKRTVLNEISESKELYFLDIHHITGANTHKLKSRITRIIHIRICPWAFFSKNASDGF